MARWDGREQSPIVEPYAMADRTAAFRQGVRVLETQSSVACTWVQDGTAFL
jgi:hypothetical protein